MTSHALLKACGADSPSTPLIRRLHTYAREQHSCLAPQRPAGHKLPVVAGGGGHLDLTKHADRATVPGYGQSGSRRVVPATFASSTSRWASRCSVDFDGKHVLVSSPIGSRKGRSFRERNQVGVSIVTNGKRDLLLFGAQLTEHGSLGPCDLRCGALLTLSGLEWPAP